MKCQMFRVAEIRDAMKADVARASYLIMVGGLKAMAKKEASIIEQCSEYIASLPEVLATMEEDTSDTKSVSWGSAEIIEYTPYAWLEPRTIKAPKCNLDLEWLGALAREIATTTPAILQYLDAKAKAQAKPKPEPKPEPERKQGRTPFDNFWKFPCRFEGKEPTCKWKDPAKQQKAPINPKWFNTGIPTGTRNNLLVVDLDVKDDGLEEFGKYIQEHGKPNTLHVITPTGGEHYYFNYAHADPETAQMIKTFLKNSTKFRGKGIDIRSEGGYIVAPPSRREGKAYEADNLTKPIDIPPSLVAWLLEGQESKAPKAKKVTSKALHNVQNNACTDLVNHQNLDGYKYDLNDEQIWNILEQLPDEYLTNYTKWLTVTSILKRHGKHAIWSEWSKRGGNYDEAENERKWRANEGILDINYLVWVLNQKGGNVEQIPKHKIYDPIIELPGGWKQQTGNKRYVSELLDYRTFSKHDTIVIESCTGTGKTTAIAQHMAREEGKFLSIVTRTSLADQHCKSFKDIGLVNYQDIKHSYCEQQRLVICLNSLGKLEALDDDDMTEYTVFIDEVSSLIEFTGNDLLDTIMRKIVVTLSRLLKHAKRVILSDAMINDGAFELVKNRAPGLVLKNEFKRYLNTPAVRMRNEEEFLQLLRDHCNSNQPFLFGCDSCSVATKFYYDCRETLPEELKEKMLLITADSLYRVKDATKEFKDKFVFYSPKITFGVDFTIDVPQDVFIYIAGNSILPSGSYQQATRCRNIKTLYYFGEVFQQDAFYTDLEEVKQCVESAVQASKNFNTTCTYIDENDEVKVVRNTFFNLYCYNEFVKDTYETNKVKHFEDILANNGFKLSSQGAPAKVSPETKAQQTQVMADINDTMFEEFIESSSKFEDKYQNLVKTIQYLKLPIDDREALTTYKDEIMSKWAVRDHDAIVRFFKSNEYINDKVSELNFKGIDIKTLGTSYNKLKILREFEARHGISVWNPVVTINAEMDDAFYNLIKTAFRTKLQKPTTPEEVVKFYGALVKSATCRNLINVKKNVIKINDELAMYHLELNSYKNTRRLGFSPEAKQYFGIESNEVPYMNGADLGLDD